MLCKNCKFFTGHHKTPNRPDVLFGFCDIKLPPPYDRKDLDDSLTVGDFGCDLGQPLPEKEPTS